VTDRHPGRGPRIDLHTHSTASDGTTSPAELVRAAAEAGVDVLGLTDHDTTAGWAEAVAALPAGLTLVRGAELSCVWLEDGAAPTSLHLLAYLFDPEEPELAAERRRVREGRTERAGRMVALLRADGHDVDLEAVLAEAQGGPVGRPHVARVLVARGLVPDIAAAFTPDWIGVGGRYRSDKPDTEACRAVRMVRAAGGVAVFAHPLAGRRGRLVPETAYARLAEAGLAGIEADHPDHTPADRERARGLAADLGLFVTGSSDFHGAGKPVRLGEHATTGMAALDRLVGAATGCAPVTG